MKFMAIGVLFLFLIVSIGAVSATEEINNETISTDNPIEMEGVVLNDGPAVLQSTEYNKYGESETNNTLTDLAKDISASGEVLEIEKDYKFNNADIRKPIGIVKDNFVINIKPDFEFKSYTITYASGRIETKIFSVDEYLSDIKDLKKQYLLYKKDYLEKIKTMFINVWSKRIIELLFAIGSVYLVSNMDISLLFKDIYLILMIFITLVIQVIGYEITDSLKELIYHIGICDKLLIDDNDYVVPVNVNSNSFNWPLLNLGNVEQFNNYQLDLLSRFTDDTKISIGVEISNRISLR
jgi:hypothetical protein